MKNIVRILLLVCCLVFMFPIVACGDGGNTSSGGDSTSIEEREGIYNVVFKLKTDEYTFTYNSSTNDVVKEVAVGETLGEDFITVDDNQEIQNQEYKIIGWYFYDKEGNKQSIDKNTVMTAENLNIESDVSMIIVYAKVKNLWL